MAILNATSYPPGLVDVIPSVIYIETNDTVATVTATGYLNKRVQQGYVFQESMMALVSTKTAPNAAVVTVGWYDISKSGENWSLIPSTGQLIRQYVSVPITAAQFNGMYAAPIELVPAAGASTLLVLDQLQLVMTYNSAAYAAGGVAAVQYDATINGAGVIASTTLAAATFQSTASTTYTMNAGVVALPFTTTANKGLYLSNITGAFTTGDSPMVAHVWYRTIPTV